MTPSSSERHVLFVLHSLASGGAERVVSLLANHWASAGRRVTIATYAPPTRDHYRLDPAVTRLQLAPEVYESRGLLANIRRIRALREALRVQRPDVAVALMESTNVLLALARSARRGPVCIGAERIHPPRHAVTPVWAWLRRIAYGRLDAVVAQTEATAAWLRAHTRARRVAVIPNPIATPQPVEPAAAAAAAARRPFVLAVGRLHPQKGFDLLIEAFASLAARHHTLGLVILGAGPEGPALRRRATELGIGERVVFPGNVVDVAPWYRNAEVYVLSSRFEGFPNALLEAMAHGCAVIATDCETGPSDIIRDGRDGVLVPVGQVQALAEAMAALLDAPQRRAELGRTAAEVSRRFALPGIAACWDRLFAAVRPR